MMTLAFAAAFAGNLDAEALVGLQPGVGVTVSQPVWRGGFISVNLGMTRSLYTAFPAIGSFTRRRNLRVELLPGLGWTLTPHPRWDLFLAAHVGPALFYVDEEIQIERYGVNARYQRVEVGIRAGVRSGLRVRASDRLGLVLTNWTPTTDVLLGLRVGVGITWSFGPTEDVRRSGTGLAGLRD